MGMVGRVGQSIYKSRTTLFITSTYAQFYSSICYTLSGMSVIYLSAVSVFNFNFTFVLVLNIYYSHISTISIISLLSTM